MGRIRQAIGRALAVEATTSALADVEQEIEKSATLRRSLQSLSSRMARQIKIAQAQQQALDEIIKGLPTPEREEGEEQLPGEPFQLDLDPASLPSAAAHRPEPSREHPKAAIYRRFRGA